MMRLRTRMVLTYTACLCAAVMLLSFGAQYFAGYLFQGFVRRNIKAQSEDIVASIGRQFDEKTGSFNQATLMAVGMDFAYRGYIISLEDPNGAVIWDARECNMEVCSAIMQQTLDRMAAHKLEGQVQVTRHPVTVDGTLLGYVNIETFGPVFYSEAESDFMNSLNKLLLISGVVFLLITIGISILLAASIARPVRNASQTARKIADGDFSARMTVDRTATEIHELSQSVNDLATALENGERWQKRLTSNISHELRTPLTTLQGNMEAMIDGVWEPTPQRLISCHEEIVRLARLVEDLNEVSLLEQENLLLHKTEFDLAALCSKVIAQLQPLVGSKPLAIVYQPVSLLVYADPHRIKQVLINLLSNAIRHTDEGTITVEAVKAGSWLEISVADTGSGIGEEDLAHIFDRFYRSDKSRSRNTGGTGIGLTITKALVEAHGGTIEVTSQPGHGSVFKVILPGCFTAG